MLSEWDIRDFLGYVANETNRWGIEGNGSDGSRNGYHVDLTANIPLEMEGDKPGAYDMVFRSSASLFRCRYAYIEGKGYALSMV